MTLTWMGVLLLFSAFFSGSETAFFSLAPENVTALARSRSGVDRTIYRLLADPGSLLATILLGNLAINVLYFTLAAVALGQMDGQVGVAAASIGFLVAIVICGELVPKTLALGSPLGLARLAAMPLSVVVVACSPLRRLLRLVTDPLIRVSGQGERGRYLTADEVGRVIHGHSALFGLDARTATLLREVVELSDIRVNEVMIPRVDVPSFELDRGIEALRETMRRDRLPWVLLHKKGVDRALGIVTARRVFLTDGDRSLIDRIDRVPVIPEVATLIGALRTFRGSGATRALVVDEYGGLAGVLTVEELAEEIVGEISEEYEKPGDEIRQVGPDAWHLEGALGLREWSEAFSTSLEESPAAVETVGGLVTSRLGRIPVDGDTVRLGSYELTVRRVRRRRVVLLEMRPAADAGEETP